MRRTVVVALTCFGHAERFEIRVRHSQTLAHTMHSALVCTALRHALFGTGFTNIALFTHASTIKASTVAIAVVRARPLVTEIALEALVADAHSLGRLAMLAYRLIAIRAHPFVKTHTSTLNARAVLRALLWPAGRL